jgi:hypothetical protein
MLRAPRCSRTRRSVLCTLLFFSVLLLTIVLPPARPAAAAAAARRRGAARGGAARGAVSPATAPPPAPSAPPFPPPPLAAAHARGHNLSLGGVYIYHSNALATLSVLRQYRAAYADARLFMACDAGCLDLRAAATHFGAAHDGAAHLITPKKKRGGYYDRMSADAFVRVLRAALDGMADPFFILLEDDVAVLARVASPLPYDINGAVLDKQVIGGPLEWARAHRRAPRRAGADGADGDDGDDVNEIPLAGFGGAIFRTDFFRGLLRDAAALTEDLDALFAAAAAGEPPFVALGTDYLLASLAVGHGGSVGNFEGFCDFNEESERHCRGMRARGELEVLHGVKDLYGHDDWATPADLAILGGSWRNELVPALREGEADDMAW